MKLRRRDTGAEFALEPGMTVGRLAGCGVQVEDASVSRRHARVEDRAGEWWMVDLGSSNGTQCNGRAGSEFRLRNGDLLTFGAVAFDVVGPGPQSTGVRAGGRAPSAPHDGPEPAQSELAEQERARIRAQLKQARRSSGFGDLSQQPLVVRLLVFVLAAAVLVGVMMGVRNLARLL